MLARFFTIMKHMVSYEFITLTPNDNLTTPYIFHRHLYNVKQTLNSPAMSTLEQSMTPFKTRKYFVELNTTAGIILI